MARILAYTSPAPGQLFPVVDTLLELRRRGHDVHLRTRAEDVEPLRGLGLATDAVDPRIDVDALDDWRARSQVDALRRIMRWYDANRSFEIDDMRAALDAVRPDALIVDIQSEGAGYVAEASGLPWATYCPYPPALRSADAPPHGMGWAPARGALGRARDRIWHRLGERVLRPYVATRNDARAGLGLPPLRHFDDQWRRAPLFIAFTAEPYEYSRRDWPTSVRLVGPGTWEPPAEPPDWLADERRPIVLVTASTAYQADERLIATALDAFGGEEVALVVTTAAVDPAPFAAPPNARVARFLPHGPIIERAACVVSHGGQGTTQRALASGVPLCVVPFCRDQFDVARRVEVAGAGVRLHHKRLSAGRLRSAVREAVGKRAGAERVRAGFAAAGGAPAAADAFEDLLPPAVTAGTGSATGGRAA
jgi:MGT family glycosyltransferase